MLHGWDVYSHLSHFWVKSIYIYIHIYSIHGASGILEGGLTDQWKTHRLIAPVMISWTGPWSSIHGVSYALNLAGRWMIYHGKWQSKMDDHLGVAL